MAKTARPGRPRAGSEHSRKVQQFNDLMGDPDFKSTVTKSEESDREVVHVLKEVMLQYVVGMGIGESLRDAFMVMAPSQDEPRITVLEWDIGLKRMGLQIDARIYRYLFKKATGGDRIMSWMQFGKFLMGPTLHRLGEALVLVERNREGIRARTRRFVELLWHSSKKNHAFMGLKFQEKLQMDLLCTLWTVLKQVRGTLDFPGLWTVLENCEAANFQVWEKPILATICATITTDGVIDPVDFVCVLVLLSAVTDVRAKFHALFFVFDDDTDGCLHAKQIAELFQRVRRLAPIVEQDQFLIQAIGLFQHRLADAEAARLVKACTHALGWAHARPDALVNAGELWKALSHPPVPLINTVLPRSMLVTWALPSYPKVQRLMSSVALTRRRHRFLKTLRPSSSTTSLGFSSSAASFFTEEQRTRASLSGDMLNLTTPSADWGSTAGSIPGLGRSQTFSEGGVPRRGANLATPAQRAQALLQQNDELLQAAVRSAFADSDSEDEDPPTRQPERRPPLTRIKTPTQALAESMRRKAPAALPTLVDEATAVCLANRVLAEDPPPAALPPPSMRYGLEHCNPAYKEEVQARVRDALGASSSSRPTEQPPERDVSVLKRCADVRAFIQDVKGQQRKLGVPTKLFGEEGARCYKLYANAKVRMQMSGKGHSRSLDMLGTEGELTYKCAACEHVHDLLDRPGQRQGRARRAGRA